MVAGIFFLAAFVAVILALAAMYNGLVRLRQISNEAWSDIDVQLKRRYDLIPNLVETVKGYAGHEREVFEKVTEARSRAMSAPGPATRGEAEGQLTTALKSLFAVAENYPALKANENFLSLQQSLSEVEETIQNARRYYNAVVRDLNTKIETVPTNIVANMFNFREREFFQLESPEERRAVRVSFERS